MTLDLNQTELLRMCKLEIFKTLAPCSFFLMSLVLGFVFYLYSGELPSE